MCQKCEISGLLSFSTEPDSLHYHLLSGVLMASGNICYWELTCITLNFFIVHVFPFLCQEKFGRLFQSTERPLLNSVWKKSLGSFSVQSSYRGNLFRCCRLRHHWMLESGGASFKQTYLRLCSVQKLSIQLYIFYYVAPFLRMNVFFIPASVSY